MFRWLYFVVVENMLHVGGVPNRSGNVINMLALVAATALALTLPFPASVWVAVGSEIVAELLWLAQKSESDIMYAIGYVVHPAAFAGLIGGIIATILAIL